MRHGTTKLIKTGDDARNTLARGFEQVAGPVGATLGPAGRLATLDQNHLPPVVTKDGVTVAKHITLEDPFEDKGAHLLIDVAAQCNREVGDGTTTATILANRIVQEGIRHAEKGLNTSDVRRGIDHAVALALDHMEESAQPIETSDQIKTIATIAANGNDHVGGLIAEAYDKIGEHGVIVMHDTPEPRCRVEVVDGIQFDRGLVAPIFVNEPERGVCDFEEPMVLCIEGTVPGDVDALRFTIGKAADAKRAIVIIADDFEHAFLASCAGNKAQGSVRCALVRAPGHGENRAAMLEDLALFSGGRVINVKMGQKLSDIQPDDIGSVAKFVSGQKTTTMTGGMGSPEQREQQIQKINTLIAEASSDFEREKAEKRLAWLAGGVAMIYVGAASESEQKELRDRVEDALNAAKAAKDGGVVLGGGCAMGNSAGAIMDGEGYASKAFGIGVQIVHDALFEPIRQLARNAGDDPAVIQRDFMISPHQEGYDATERKIVDLRERDLLVPFKVEKTALEVAASVAGLVLDTQSLVVTKPETD